MRTHAHTRAHMQLVSYTHVQFCQRERVPCELSILRMEEDEHAALLKAQEVGGKGVKDGKGGNAE